jgi:type II secretory pathway component PulK
MSPRKNTPESGFALILALLALALLTTMGLALANSSSVELQIATNQRWAESARYNAEAGLEYAK